MRPKRLSSPASVSLLPYSITSHCTRNSCSSRASSPRSTSRAGPATSLAASSEYSARRCTPTSTLVITDSRFTGACTRFRYT